MLNVTTIRDHMEVMGSHGEHVGTVDGIDGDSIKLARHDPASDGHHHWVPLDWVVRVDEHVHLNRSRDQAVEEWETEALAAAD